jgi:hypothetical protein
MEKGLIRGIYHPVEMAEEAILYRINSKMYRSLIQAENTVKKLEGESPYSIRETVCVPPRYWDREFLIANII